MSPATLACSALLLGLTVHQAPPPAPKPGKPAAPVVELRYPTFEPFVASRMFGVMIGDPAKFDLKEAREQLAKIAEANKTAKDAGEKFARPKHPDAPSAELVPAAPEEARFAYSLLPAVMMRIQPLWETREWSEEQVALATEAAACLAIEPSAPKVAFAKGKPAENRAGLEKLVRWFHGLVARPELYAAMIATMDDGPFMGLPYEAAQPLPAAQTKTLDEQTELRLCKVERPREPWVLQCVREGKLAWSRVISAAPDESVVELGFRDSKPMPLGTYGWKVFLQAKWSYGSEACYLYLGPDAKLLFYYLSW